MKDPKKNTYVFEWLDNLISFDLHPSYALSDPLPEEDVDDMIGKVKSELISVSNSFRQQFFSEKGEGTSEMLIIKNYDAITVMLNKTYNHLRDSNAAHLKPVLEAVMVTLNELRSFFKTNFAKYLNAELHMPLVELHEFRQQIIDKRPALIQKLYDTGNTDEVSAIVLEALDLFADRIDRQELITERELVYHQSIIRDIEEYNGQESALSTCPSLHELLVYWNLNSKSCIRYFSMGMEIRVQEMELVDDQLEFMRLQWKNINTLPMIPSFIYNPEFPSLKEYFSDYISNEITYLEKKRIVFQPNESYNAEKNKTAAFKILSAFTGDQLALVLRGMSDAKLIKAKSLSSVFTSIVPFISTQQKEHLSPDAIRVKSYEGTDRDIDIVVESLYHLADIIKNYA